MEKLLLIDGHSMLNRAFFGLPDLTNAKGVHTNAVYGFLNILFKVLDDEAPDYLTVAFDVHAPTFRHEMFGEYKGTRKPMDPNLRQQVPMMKEMLRAMGVVVMEKEGLEADDLLGTLARRAEGEGLSVVILSGDRDLLQLATKQVRVSIPKTKKTGTEIEHYYEKDVIEAMGVTPTEFIDVKALWGDASDNIPGVPGIGEKTAKAIIAKYHSIEEAYAHVDELKPPRASKNLKEFYDQAKLSKELATIVVDADIEYDLASARISDLYTQEAYLLCREWEFKNLLSRFDGGGTLKDDIIDRFIRFNTVDEAVDWLNGIEAGDDEKKGLGFSIFQDGERICALGLSNGERGGFYTPKNVEEIEKILIRLYKQFPDRTIGNMDIKKSLNYMSREGCDKAQEAWMSQEARAGAFDLSVAAYLLNPLAKEYDATDIAKEHLGRIIPSLAELLEKTKPQKAWKEKPEIVEKWVCYEAYVAAAAPEKLMDALREQGMDRLYDDIERPLVYTLFEMEREGIGIDAGALEEYGKNLEGRIGELEKKIYEEAGEEFNINSPKQLGEILFGKMGLPGGKRTKTGYSTAADTLEKLAPYEPVVADVLQYRQYSKLKSTYADGLADCIAPDGRIHTTFEQTVTATGRLSSANPNLQNIPIRIELGKEIRKVFHPRDGFVFVDADYSQIELRVLAHMSGDENLIGAYRQDQDIHRATAAQVFGVPFEEVTDLQRRNAKAVNFGIVYGISAFGLGEDLAISRQEAQAYIDDYYKAYPGLKVYLDGCVRFAKEKGYSLTMFGRRRPLPEIASSNFMQRSFGERVAMNAPIQGTAADIIKIAMNRVSDRLKKEGMESKLILQVHDELLIEAKEEEAQKAREILEEEMKRAADLAVELVIDVHEGSTWYDAK